MFVLFELRLLIIPLVSFLNLHSSKIIEFAIGTLDSDIELKPDVHIFTDSKASWHEVTDHLPQYTEGRDSDPATNKT